MNARKPSEGVAGLHRARVTQRSLKRHKENPKQAHEDKSGKSSEEEHRADALAPSAEEGRGKLRKATGSRKQAESRRCPNGETRRVEDPSR